MKVFGLRREVYQFARHHGLSAEQAARAVRVRVERSFGPYLWRWLETRTSWGLALPPATSADRA